MTALTEILLALLLLTDLSLAVSSRLLHCIRIAAFQGLVIALFPLAGWNWQGGAPSFQLLFVALVSLIVKGVFLPGMLRRAMYKANVRRELEPLVGYGTSLLIVLLAMAGSFLLCRHGLRLPAEIPVLCVPAAISTLFVGLFMIMARRKALAQVIGFLIFENGITVFGLGMMVEYGILVELGILLDVFVLVFIMGITLFQINREFSHIDSDQLHLLGDDQSRGGDK